MELNELKKIFYKTGQDAYLINIRKDGIVYQTIVEGEVISFIVPFNEVGETIWEKTIPAKLLIRYINKSS